MKTVFFVAFTFFSLSISNAFADLTRRNANNCDQKNQLVADLEVTPVGYKTKESGFEFVLYKSIVKSIKCNTFTSYAISKLAAGDVIVVGNAVPGWLLNQKIIANPSFDQIETLPVLLVDYFSKNYFNYKVGLAGWKEASPAVKELVLLKKDYFPEIKITSGKYLVSDFFSYEYPNTLRSQEQLNELRKSTLFSAENVKKLSDYLEIKVNESISHVSYWNNEVIAFSYEYNLSGCKNSYKKDGFFENQLVIFCEEALSISKSEKLVY